MPEECRPVEVDGETVMVRGSEPMNEEDRAALAVIVRAVKAKMRADRPTPEQMQEWAGMLGNREMSALRARSLARRFLGELETERERLADVEAKLKTIHTWAQQWAWGLGGTDPESFAANNVPEFTAAEQQVWDGEFILRLIDGTATPNERQTEPSVGDGDG